MFVSQIPIDQQKVDETKRVEMEIESQPEKKLASENVEDVTENVASDAEPHQPAEEEPVSGPAGDEPAQSTRGVCSYCK